MGKPKKPRQFRRSLGTRRYNKIFIVAAEGDKTELQYFRMLNSINNSVIHFKCLKNIHGSSPKQILKLMRDHIKAKGLDKRDEAWLVVDKDCWPEDQLNALIKWTKEKENYYLALSNPKFEYWLLLHFEDGRGIKSSRHCSEKLKVHLPRYNKDIQESKIKPRIPEAVSRAKKQDTPRCRTWPKKNGTTVYRLVEHVFS